MINVERFIKPLLGSAQDQGTTTIKGVETPNVALVAMMTSYDFDTHKAESSRVVYGTSSQLLTQLGHILRTFPPMERMDFLSGLMAEAVDEMYGDDMEGE